MQAKLITLTSKNKQQIIQTGQNDRFGCFLGLTEFKNDPSHRSVWIWCLLKTCISVQGKSKRA